MSEIRINISLWTLLTMNNFEYIFCNKNQKYEVIMSMTSHPIIQTLKWKVANQNDNHIVVLLVHTQFTSC